MNDHVQTIVETPTTSYAAPQPDDGGTPTAAACAQSVITPAIATTIAIVASLLSLITYHIAYVAPHTVRIGVVDMLTVVRQKEASLAQVLAKDGVTQAERQEAINAASEFAKALPQTLADLSAECNCTLFAANAVAGRIGTVDMTPALRVKVGL